MLKIRSTYLLVMLLGSALVSCNPNADEALADHSFVTGKPCPPPCWYGLELDKSTEEEVYATLRELPFVDQDTIGEWGTTWLNDENAKEIYYACLSPRLEMCGGALLSEDRLKRLWMSVGYELTFKVAVDKLGPPEYVEFYQLLPHRSGCAIDLEWPDRGIMVGSLDPDSHAQCELLEAGNEVSPSTRVAVIYYYSVTEAFGSEPGGCCTRIPWPGFAKP